MKVAIVHDWLIGGGAEKVVEALHQLYPDAPIFTAVATPEWRQRLDDKVIVSPMSKYGLNNIRKFLPKFRQKWFESLDMSEFDLVLSSSGAEAKGVNTSDKALHISYIHAPTHYYWGKYDEYRKEPGFGLLNPVAKVGLRSLIEPMRKWDLAAAYKPDILIANSNYTAEGIKRYYGRKSIVIHPPVNVEHFKSSTNLSTTPRGDYFLCAGRQVPYKKHDLVIEACIKTGQRLIVAGDGPMHSKLASLAANKINITLKPEVSDTEMKELMQGARGFVFAGVDDFGIIAVEALGAGTPIIAYKQGGALDYVDESINGIFFDEQTPECLAKALLDFEDKIFDHEVVAESVANFSTEKFKLNYYNYVQKEYQKWKVTHQN